MYTIFVKYTTHEDVDTDGVCSSDDDSDYYNGDYNSKNFCRMVQSFKSKRISLQRVSICN